MNNEDITDEELSPNTLIAITEKNLQFEEELI